MAGVPFQSNRDSTGECSSSKVSDDSDVINGTEYEETTVHEGELFKWTNYFYGWQSRYVVLTQLSIYYGLNKEKSSTNAHGMISLDKILLKIHEKDELRFDIHGPSVTYFFKARSTDERKLWIDKITGAKESRIDNYSMRKHGSFSSLGSISSLNSTKSSIVPSAKQNLVEAIEQLEHMRFQMFNQIDNLQSYFEDACYKSQDCIHKDETHQDADDSDDAIYVDITSLRKGNSETNGETNAENSDHVVRRIIRHKYSNSSHLFGCQIPKTTSSTKRTTFYPRTRNLSYKSNNIQDEISSFRTNATGIMSALSSCLELLTQAETLWKTRLLKERGINKKLQMKISQLNEKICQLRSYGGPDMQEGPHSTLSEDEFFDAIDNSVQVQEHDTASSIRNEADKVVDDKDKVLVLLETKISTCIRFLTSNVLTEPDWVLDQKVSNTRVYKKLVEIDGIVVDPHLVMHTYHGVTAKELCEYFWDIKYRRETDFTVDTATVLSSYDDSTIIVHQLHKHVWPASRRDVCILSHKRKLDDLGLSDKMISSHGHSSENLSPVGSPWIVVNFSVDHPDAKCINSIRATADISMMAQTFVKKSGSIEDLNNINRENIICIMNYSAVVNPGGWLPPAAVRAVARREFLRFVNRFGDFVTKSTKNQPVKL